MTNMINALINLSRKNKYTIAVLFDFFTVIFSIFCAFYLRIGDWNYLIEDRNLLIATCIAPLIAIPIFIQFRLYNILIRYVGFKELLRIIQAASVYAISWGLVAFMLVSWDAFPRSVILINWIFAFVIISVTKIVELSTP